MYILHGIQAEYKHTDACMYHLHLGEEHVRRTVSEEDKIRLVFLHHQGQLRSVVTEYEIDVNFKGGEAKVIPNEAGHAGMASLRVAKENLVDVGGHMATAEQQWNFQLYSSSDWS